MLLKNNLLKEYPAPLVSICCVTYNHGLFLRECLNGFVKQKTNFAFEILVHEDASTDDTAEILREFEYAYPHLFRCVYQEENQFYKQNTLLNILFPMIRGKYWALCEGDDYWTDEFKLQKQIDFLESHPQFSMSCTNSYFAREVNDYALDPKDVLVDNKRATGEILQHEILYRNLISTLTCVFRQGKVIIPEWFHKVELGDWTFHILYSMVGKVGYMQDITGAYRLHKKGMFSELGERKQLPVYIKTGEIIRANIDPGLSKIMIPGQRDRLKQLLALLLESKDYKSYFSYLRKYNKLLIKKEVLTLIYTPAKKFAGEFYRNTKPGIKKPFKK